MIPAVLAGLGQTMPGLGRVLPWALVGALTVVLLGRCGARRPDPVQPLVVESEALLARVAQAEREVERLREAAALAAAEAERQAQLAARRQRTASALGRAADSLAAVAEARAGAAEEAASWRSAYTARTIERDTLVAALQASEAGRVAALTRAAEAEGARDLAIEQTRALRGFVAQLQDELRDLEPRCRVLGRVPCPSRTAVGVATFVGGVVLTATALK